MLESDLVYFWIVNPGGNVSRWRILNGSVSLIQSISAGSTPPGGSIFADHGVCVYAADQTAVCWGADQMGPRTQIDLSDIVTGICERVGMSSGQLNATALTDGVWGFQIDNR